MSAFRAGLRCRIVRPIYGWESTAALYMGKTLRITRSVNKGGHIGRAWYFEMEPKLPDSHELAEAFNSGYLWVQEVAITPTGLGFGAWYRKVEGRWPQEHV